MEQCVFGWSMPSQLKVVITVLSQLLIKTGFFLLFYGMKATILIFLENNSHSIVFFNFFYLDILLLKISTRRKSWTKKNLNLGQLHGNYANREWGDVHPKIWSLWWTKFSMHLSPTQYFLPLEASPGSPTRGGLSSSTPCFSKDTTAVWIS